MKQHRCLCPILAAVIAVFAAFAAGPACAQSVPPIPGWQIMTASSADVYADTPCDTAIARTCGASLTVTCARSVENGLPLHRFLVRDMNSTRYSCIELRSTITGQHSRTCYYVHDMRVSDSVCLFCGTKVSLLEETFFPPATADGGSTDPYLVIRTDSTGFIGRFSLADFMRSMNGTSLSRAETFDDQGPYLPTQPSSVSIDLELLDIPSAKNFSRMWVPDGLHADALQHHLFFNGQVADPYCHVKAFYDQRFSIDSATAYLVGTARPSGRSCIAEVNNLRPSSASSSVSILCSPIEDEVFTDVSGNDCRVIFTSRLRNDMSAPDGSLIHSRHTVGARYKDLSNGDDDYRNRLHLYSHYDSAPSYALYDDEHAHPARIMNTYDEFWNEFGEKDFCLVYACQHGDDQLQRNTARVKVLNIDANMDVDLSFWLGNIDGTSFPRSSIKDAAYLYGHPRNCLAILYNKHLFAPFMDLPEWGYSQIPALNNDTYIHNARLQLNAPASSVDVFFNGLHLLYAEPLGKKGLRLVTQRRGNVMDRQDRTVSCETGFRLPGQVEVFTRHTFLGDDELSVNGFEYDWRPTPGTYPVREAHAECRQEAAIKEPNESETPSQQ